jgi:hypothetical protein
LTIIIWDNEKSEEVVSNEDLFMSIDGKVYEITAACFNGDVWLDKTDVSNRYIAVNRRES